MRSSYLSEMAFSLGARRLGIAESAAAGRVLSSTADLESAGFRWHHLCRPDQTSYSLVTDAVRRLRLPDRVDAIVYNTCLPLNGNTGAQDEWKRTGDVKHLMDFPGSRLQADFDLAPAAVFGLNQQGCTGMLGALRLANALLAVEPDWDTVLCVTADRFPEDSVYEQSYNVISDGAAACLVSGKADGFRILASHQVTNGGLHSASDDQTVGLFFSYVPQLVREVVAKAGLTTADIDWVVPQNTNSSAWKIAGRLLGFPEERVWQSTLGEVGHAISADNVINLSALVEGAAVLPGQRVLLVMAGHGLNWQATILEATENTP